MSKIRVLPADDHQTVLQRVCRLLAEDFDVVGTVNNGRDAVMEVERLDPDVLVMDISMPILNGLRAAQRLLAKKRRAKVIFLRVHTDRDFVAAALSAGASGYVTKSDVTTDLVPAIREALAGRTYISTSIALKSNSFTPISPPQEPEACFAQKIKGAYGGGGVVTARSG